MAECIMCGIYYLYEDMSNEDKEICKECMTDEIRASMGNIGY